MKNNSWMAEDIEKLADFFDKSILYFFDREEKAFQVNEPSETYYSCKGCIEKQREIDRLRLRIDDISDRYIELLESKNGKSRDCV